MSLDINIQKLSNHCKISLIGKCTIYNVGKLKKSFIATIEENENILIDLSQVSDFDTAGLQLFVAAKNTIKNDYALPKVVRELPIATSEDEQNRRPDLLIKWKDGTFTHIEVKKYDSDFIKTFPTSKYINEYFKTSAQHFILIPEESREKCLKELDKEKNKFPSIKINLLIWNDVAASLRNTLINPDNKESNEWNVWANSFLGCIEQKLLGFTAFNQKLPMQGITKLINHHNKLLEYKNMPNLKEEEFKFLIELSFFYHFQDKYE